MTKIESLLEQLPAAQRTQVENFAASLLNRSSRQAAVETGRKPNRICVEKLDGMLVRSTDDMSDDQISNEVLNAWADAAED